MTTYLSSHTTPCSWCASGLKSGDGGGYGDRPQHYIGWDGGTMPVLDDAGRPPVVFSEGLPGGIPLRRCLNGGAQC